MNAPQTIFDRWKPNNKPVCHVAAVIVWLLVGLMIAAALQDAVQLKISNLITGFVLGLAVIAMLTSGPTIGLWQNAAVFLVLLGVGTILFSNGVLGGGDVKLLAAVGLWTDGASALRLIVATCLAGGVLALLIIVLRTVVPAAAAARVKTLKPKAGIPYGIAIAVGAILVIYMSQMNARAGTYNSNIPSIQLG